MTSKRRQPAPSWGQIKAYVEGALRQERSRAEHRLAQTLEKERRIATKDIGSIERSLARDIDVIAVEVSRHRDELDALSSAN